MALCLLVTVAHSEAEVGWKRSPWSSEIGNQNHTISRLPALAFDTNARLLLTCENALEWLTPDRLVQRTNFGNEVVLTANFGAAVFADVKPGCVQARLVRAREVRTLCP